MTADFGLDAVLKRHDTKLLTVPISELPHATRPLDLLLDLVQSGD